MPLAIPESMKEEHEELHQELRKATEMLGPVGQAAKKVAQIFHPHFEKENEIALPEIGVARELAEGKTSPDFAAAKELCDRFSVEYPKMLEEHVSIMKALDELEEAAMTAGERSVVEFTRKLKLHAKTEEALTYPAIIMIGRLCARAMSSDVVMASPESRFTLEDLKQYNGTNGKPVYFAYKGKVYDASDNPLWTGGNHQGTHKAGHDLTNQMDPAIHGEDELAMVKAIGVLVETPENIVKETQPKYTIEVDREGCIACGVCYTADPTHFESGDEGKTKVVGGTSNGKSVGSFDDDKIEDAKSAALACPVGVITVNQA
jgi:predicted heme/steroid binding protein/ferredoxin